MAKTSYDEIENINDVDGPMSSTSIHPVASQDACNADTEPPTAEDEYINSVVDPQFNANLWPQPQAALFTCTTVSHLGHVFLRYIELTHSICNYHKQ